MIKVRATTAAALKLHGEAVKLGRQLALLSGTSGVRSAVLDGHIAKATKLNDHVRVDVVEVPGRLVGSNHFRDSLFDSLVGESTIDGLVVSSSPTIGAMAPSGEVSEFNTEATPGVPGQAFAFGAPLPEGAHCILASWSTEFDGGVVFVQKYTEVEPERDTNGDYIITDQQVWLAVLVKWAGAGPMRSVTFSDDFAAERFGGSLTLRSRVIPGTGSLFSPPALSGGLPKAHYANGELVIAIETDLPAPTVNDVLGGLAVLCVRYPDSEAEIAWLRTFGPDDFGPDLEPEYLPAGGAAPYRMAGIDLPSVFTWADLSGDTHTVFSFRVRAWRVVSSVTGDVARLVTGQACADVVDGVGSVTVDYVDSIAGLDAGLPQVSPTTVHVQKLGDVFFLAAGSLVRYRTMRLLDRVAEDSTMGLVGRSSTLNIASDIALLRTESLAGPVQQTQRGLGYGPEEVAAGVATTNTGTGFSKVRFATPVADGEVWDFGFINGTGASQVGIARVTQDGVAAPIAAGLPRSLYLSTYQREVKDAEGNVITPMLQLATLVAGEKPLVAIKRGRFGSLDFLPAAAYSRQGTFYLATAASRPRYGSMFG